MFPYLQWPIYSGWVWNTPVIPNMYWNAYTHEQRIKNLWLNMGKVEAYLDENADNINEWADEVTNAINDFSAFASEHGYSQIQSDIESLAEEIENIEKKSYVSVKDYGAKGDGSTDDTSAIQDAIDTGYDVYFPTSKNETYKVTSTLHVAVSGQSFFCDRYSNTGIMFYASSGDHTTPLFETNHSLARFVDMHIRSNTLGTGIGIKAHADDAYSGGDVRYTNNTDVTMIGCDISNFYIGAVVNARGPWVTDCTFSELYIGLQLYWDSQTSQDEDPQNTGIGIQLYGNATGMRGIQIMDCRFHSIGGTAINLYSGNPCGMIIKGNRFDVGSGFFIKAEAGVLVKNSVITENTILYSNVQSMRFNSGLDCCSISNNSFVGINPANDDSDARNTTATHIYIAGNSYCVSITGNSFDYCIEDCIRFDYAYNCVITGNTFEHIGTGATASVVRGMVLFNQVADTCVFSNNAGTFYNAYGTIVHGRAAVPFKRTFITNNGIIGTVLNAYTDGGQNTFQDALTS